MDEARAQSVAARFGVDEIHAFRPVAESAWPSGTFDAAAAIGLLENVPGEDVPWMLEEIFRRAEKAVYLAIETGEPPAREANIDVERCIRPLEWWHARIAEAASRHPDVAWHLDAVAPDGDRVETLAGEPVEAKGDGRTVWVLEGKRKGDNAQLHRLADALGWHKQTKAMRFTKAHVTPGFLLGASLANLTPDSRRQLKAPWPDIVIAAGKRSAATARWIRQQSGGKTRLVHVGRPWMRLDAFDLIVTTPQYRLPARPNVLHNALPLTPVTEEALAAARKDAAVGPEMKELPEPRIALLVGGDSWSYKLDARAARAIGQSADALAQQLGGSLMITTSPRTRREAADALLAEITVPHMAHIWTADSASNPYLAYLSMADEVMVTGDSASLLADACATGKPVSIFELPLRLHAGALAVPFRAFTKWRQGISSYRGTPRQQDGLSRFYDDLVDRGVITPARDLRRLHEFAAIRGLAHLVGSADKAHMKVPRHDLERAVSRVRRLFTDGRRV